MSKTHFFGLREHLDHERIGYPFREVVFVVIRERFYDATQHLVLKKRCDVLLCLTA